MPGKQDDRKLPEMPVAEALAEQGTTPQQPSGTGGGARGGGRGIASGHNPGGMVPGGGPAASPGGIGTGGGQTEDRESGSLRRDGR